MCVFFYLIEQYSKFLLHTLQVLYMCTLCDSTNINTMMGFVPHVSGDGFNGGSDSYLQFRHTHFSPPDTHAPCIPVPSVPRYTRTLYIRTFSPPIHTHPVYSYLQFRDTQAPCLLKLCIAPSNGIVRWWLFPEFGAELPLDNCTPTIILNNPVYVRQG